mgnify:CR=1 FL=1
MSEHDQILLEKIERSNGPERIAKARAGRGKVLHILPSTLDLPHLFFHGSTKDIRCRTEYFKSRGLEVDEFLLLRRQTKAIEWLEMFDKHVRPLAQYECFFVDIPGTYPQVFRYLKRKAPKAQLVFRSHNAEFFHRLDWMRGEKSLAKKWEFFRQALEGTAGDIQVIRLCDWVFPITEWDTKHYWLPLARMVGATRKIRTVPYFLPSDRLPPFQSERPVAKGRRNCVCLGTVSKAGGQNVHVGPLAEDQYRQFSRLVSELPAAVKQEWNFYLTGDVPRGIALSSEIISTGPLPSPFDALKDASVACLLSELGRGFKTKILDSILCGVPLILPQELWGRLPAEIQGFCIPMRSTDSQELARCLEASRQMKAPDTRVNEAFSERANAGLDEALSWRKPAY